MQNATPSKPHGTGQHKGHTAAEETYRTKRLRAKREFMRGARMTKDEAAAFDAAANELGLKPAEFIRMLVDHYVTNGAAATPAEV
jgi:hypothetical protein